VRRRLVIAIAAVASVAVALLAVPLGVVLSRSYRDQELLRLQRDTVAATRGVDLAVGRGDPVDLPRSPDALAVYDRNGRRVAGRGPLRAPRLVRTVLLRGRPADRSSDGTLEAVVPLVSSERVTGAVRARRSDTGATHDARATQLTLAAVALGIIGAAVLAAVLLGRGLAAPLERLAASARRLGEGDFSVRTTAPGIAEIDAVGIALDTTAQRLDDLVSRERAFSADASHQLRTPLQALRIELESVELRGDGPPELPAALAQVDRLQATIDTLLAVARDTPRTTAVTDLAAVLEEVRARWHGVLASDGRPLRVTTDVEHPRVSASGRVVGEIVDVLIDNAHRHGRGVVTVGLRPVGPFLVVDVADEGPGFAADPEAAFTRRVSADDGHGIGLALARSLAHAEGGRLAVSHAGPAPVLSLSLPRLGADARDAPAATDGFYPWRRRRRWVA
jgi:signal transduction histidine kinase